ncbi:MAG: Glycosyl transferase, family 2/glycosyl transferase family 8 [Candidatus Kaiserbacteria bacterium GW2011_GWC2_49_12]|uniref:Glycosyl transferase, family 2/glycosyl transferase family 8 n=4 Tax=Candidatus Kaiseribacteriota TaxID=1752734 RepID=A0A0G1WH00_9BACT|nr:MAG: Glycosyl transferase, family 2/glycosyl transferase family 8 [Candidatus Kaiserbacteria bacterium GW2011_GWC2_49_12]KKW18073.1 MAG: Glycosyl transferase, family 2/glycosyl transferase family 8 [Candidatus Kaiserbacteria bacterium GW2011_GWB1_50_17]KKW18566.1 MAG: Glycosyl transferase, family 2/glycosyl transferase family 8 [Candidatus Kaiserbacteria bacterium GW2011_GWA1_50_28]OGG87211.1 MAG: hypothetical protein A3H15_01300 [Candidatus Kaiserbacteria bacterium RIFCSPLOWO2_12_FULL_50_28]
MEQNTSITFSFIVRAYNAKKTLGRAIESALSQDFDGPYEVIVVDDGSTDGTAEVLSSFTDERISLIQQENKGLIGASQTGLEAARGVVIMLLDADDESFSHTIRTVMPKFADSSIDYVYGDYHEEFEGTTKLVKASDVFKVPAGGIAWRREKLRVAGGFVGDTIFPEYELLLRMWGSWRGTYIAESLFLYHRDVSSITGDRKLVERAIEIICAKFPERAEQVNLIRSYDPLAT